MTAFDPLRLLAGTLLFMGVYYIAFYNGRRYERDHPKGGRP